MAPPVGCPSNAGNEPGAGGTYPEDRSENCNRVGADSSTSRILASVLTAAGERTLAVVSFGLWVAASVAAVFRTVSDGTITVWAGEQWAETGTVPEVYAPLSSLAQNSFLWFAEVPWLVAAAGFGWAVIRSGILPSWVGYVAIGWSAMWLLVFLLLRTDLPAVLALFPVLLTYVWAYVVAVMTLRTALRGCRRVRRRR